MTSLIMKTIIRVLIIFLPVVSLSYAKDTYAQQPENIVILGLGMMIILGIILGFIWWDRRIRASRIQKSRNIMSNPVAAKKHH